MRPRWRWWLFCLALEVFWDIGHRRGWKWPGDLMAWCVLPEWLGDGSKCGEGEPF